MQSTQIRDVLEKMIGILSRFLYAVSTKNDKNNFLVDTM